MSPRDGSNVYHRPPGTDGIPNTTIASTPYNGYVADVEQDLNLPRPIVAGGTGATNAHDAMIALSGEIASQVVTNYDSFPFVPGSFYSAAGATSSPTAQGFNGICYATGNYVTLEGREVVGTGLGRKFVRQSHAGVWDPWKEQPSSIADLDAAYVNVAGDTMTGALHVPQMAQALAVGASGGLNAAFSCRFDPSSYSGVEISSSSAGTAGNILGVLNNASTLWGWSWAASQAAINVSGPWNHTDATASASPTTGALTVAGGVGVAGALNAGGVITAPTIVAVGTFWSTATATTGAYQFGNSGTRYLQYDGTNFNFNGSRVIVPSLSVAAAPSQFNAGISARGSQLEWGHANTAGFGNVLSQDQGSGNPYLLFNGSQGTTSNTYKTWGVAGSIIKSDLAGGFIFGTVSNVNADNQAMVQTASLSSAGALTINGNATLQGPTTKIGQYAASSISTSLNVSYSGGGSTTGIDLRPNTNTCTAIFFLNAADTGIGSVTQTTTNVAFNTSSDGRLKEDLKTFDAGHVIDSTNVYDFAWKSTGERSYGIIAQQAVEIYPAAVTYMEEQDWYGIDYSKYVPVLLQELKALRIRVAQLEAKVNQ